VLQIIRWGPCLLVEEGAGFIFLRCCIEISLADLRVSSTCECGHFGLHPAIHAFAKLTMWGLMVPVWAFGDLVRSWSTDAVGPRDGDFVEEVSGVVICALDVCFASRWALKRDMS